MPARITNKIRLKNRLRKQWKVPRDPALKGEVNRLQKSVTRKMNEWRNDQWSVTLESLDPEDQCLWKMTNSHSLNPLVTLPPIWRYARVISILKQGKDPALSLSYRPVSLLDKTGKLFENILLTGILGKVSGRGLLRDELFVFRPKHSTSLQVAHLGKSDQELWCKQDNRRCFPRCGEGLRYSFD
jgi:hypothetical protein